MEIAPGIRRVGPDSIVNSYLLEEAGEVTIVDAGVSGLWSTLEAELAAMGRTPGDVRAIVLTHGHTDHIGFAERGRTTQGWPVWVHEADAALARGEAGRGGSGMGPARVGAIARFLWWGLRHGALRVTHLGEVATYGDGATLDVPGSPRVVLAPGHTPGSAALHVPARDALFAGDTLCTQAVTTGRRGPQIAPFSADPETARASLARLEGLEARWVLPGHGDAFAGGAAEAVRLAREAPLPR
jgi:glyoxylase-like metal-dependent hydrolase (beta-lactamase superfamily II)